MAKQESKTPTTFWIIAGVALLWNLSGLFACYTDLSMTAEAMAALPDGQREIYQANPMWMKIIYAIATITGVAGAIGLLLRKKWAIPMYLTSLITVIVQMGYTLLGTPAITIMGSTVVIFPLILIAVSATLYLYAKRARRLGILN